tara:strand:- start:168 stop:1265 length:1098 start_codon:yes stop_codon:yes gene_type:complete
MKKNFFLLFFSIIISLILVEIILGISGKYKNLTNNTLTPSDAIYERPNLSQQKHKHPDLNYIINNSFDKDGVKNFDQIPASQKNDIIAIFGDSFTENIAIDKKFEYSNLVNQKLTNNTLVNYGIGGYSADQSFIRYLKYKDHNIKHVFLFLLPGDEIFSTKSTFYNDGSYKIYKNELNIFYQILGKLNFTYFLIDSYYKIRGLLRDNHTTIKIDNYNQVLSNKINKKFYSRDTSECVAEPIICEINLLNLLITFRKEVEKNNATFHILVFPEEKYISYLTKIISKAEKKFNYYILHTDLGKPRDFENKDPTIKQLIFKNDSHWNEYGNLFFAQNLINIFDELGIRFNDSVLGVDENDIDLFYKDN